MDLKKSIKREPKVVVIGAGFAGVAAVGALRAGGINDVTLLEAQDCPGGRVQTLHLQNGFLELGAQFLHGEHGNSVFEIAEKNGLVCEPDSDDDLPDTLMQYKEFLFYLPKGIVVEQKIINKLLHILEDLQNQIYETITNGDSLDVNLSVGEFLQRRFQTYMDTAPGDEMLKKALFKWFLNWECVDSAASADQLSVPGVAKYHYVPGSGTSETKTGMAEVFKCLLRDSVPDDYLRLNKAVKKIMWKDDIKQQTYNIDERTSLKAEKIFSKNGICETISSSMYQNDQQPKKDREIDGYNISLCCDEKQESDMCEACSHKRSGPTPNANLSPNSEPYLNKVKTDCPDSLDVMNTCDQSPTDFRIKVVCEDGDHFDADHVIVTSSIGFLAENLDMFQPHLPVSHQKAIQNMGFGSVAKIFLLWEEGAVEPLQSIPGLFYPPNDEDGVEGLQFLWPEDFKPELKSVKTASLLSGDHPWYYDVVHVGPVRSQEACVVFWVGGESAIVMETLPENEVKDVLYELLGLFLNKPDIPPPERIVRTMWHSNRFTRGTYSYLATGSSLEEHDILAQPVPSNKNPILQLAGEACSKNFYSTAHGAVDTGRLAALTILRHYNLKK